MTYFTIGVLALVQAILQLAVIVLECYKFALLNDLSSGDLLICWPFSKGGIVGRYRGTTVATSGL